jgi:L-ascorbate metabolism protein UlaG (beta-lactamase superfamily)
MKLTKYGHACIVIEEQGKKLIIDPGAYTDLPAITDVTAVLFTHVHGDHFSAELLANILKNNPQARALGTHEVAAEARKSNLNVTPVDAGEHTTVEPFQLAFFGGRHALVFKDRPDNENVGVLVNNRLYYPGDSFDMPGDIQPEILALPVSGPWLKISESIEFVERVRPTKLCIPTHDAMLSPMGASITENWLLGICEQSGATFAALKPGESIEA